jgi:hypothetical protein
MSIFDDGPGGRMGFKDGFPNSLESYGDRAIEVVEDTLLMRAFNHGIQSVSIFEADLTPQQAFRSFGMMPILVDYATHVLGRSLNWSFNSGLQEKVLMDILENSSKSIQMHDMMDLVNNKLSRPALYNRADPDALLDSRTAFRDKASIPVSVTILMMDMALETSHEISQQYHMNMTGDPQMETLDLTPVCDLLAKLDYANPRVEVPKDLMMRAQAVKSAPTVTETLTEEIGTSQNSDQSNKQRG